MQSMPMYTPLICLRITAYHSVVASRLPWMGCHGSAGLTPAGTTPDSSSWRRVAT